MGHQRVTMLSRAVLLALLGTCSLASPLQDPRIESTSRHHASSTMTPRNMLALPRPGGMIPSPDGKWGLEVVSEHSFKHRKTTKTLYLVSLDVDAHATSKREPHTLLSWRTGDATSISEPLWLGAGAVGYVNTTAGSSAVWAMDLPEGKSHSTHQAKLLDLPTEVSSLKFLHTGGKGSAGTLAFSAHVWKGASIEETAHKEKVYAERGDEGWVFDDLYIREWDTWRNPAKEHQLFLVSLPDPSLAVSTPRFLAPFNASGIVSRMNPIASGEYDLARVPGSEDVQLVVAVKDPHLADAFHTRRQVYRAVVTPAALHAGTSAERAEMLTAGEQGGVSSVSFSPDGKRVVWAEQRIDGNESDRNRVVSVDLEGRKRTEWTEGWDRSPSAVAWSADSQSLYMIAENEGSALPYHLTHPGHLPTPLLFNGSASSLHVLSASHLLLDRSSLTYPTETFALEIPRTAGLGGGADGDKNPDVKLVQLTSWSEKALGRHELSEGEKFWFKGAEGKDVMGWVVKPRGWKKGQHAKWPLAFLIHGGPESAWEDAWSTRWNPNVFAQQGYFTVMINPTGSTGYGQQFTDDIHENWGGRPFKDLVAGLEHILQAHPEIDRERTAALGGSYGGYMINWIQGHNDVTKFKTFVCHDGLFETHLMYYATEEVYFPEMSNGGLPPFLNRAPYEEYNPANFVDQWHTPTLVIQGGKDFRVPEYQSVATYTALQRRGVPSRLLWFAEENHWVLNPQNSAKWHHEVFRWLNEWVGEDNAQAGERVVGSGVLRIQ